MGGVIILSDGKRITIREPEDCIELVESYMGSDMARFLQSAIHDMSGKIESLQSEVASLEGELDYSGYRHTSVLREALAALVELESKVGLGEISMSEIKEAIIEIKKEIDYNI